MIRPYHLGKFVIGKDNQARADIYLTGKLLKISFTKPNETPYNTKILIDNNELAFEGEITTSTTIYPRCIIGKEREQTTPNITTDYFYVSDHLTIIIEGGSFGDLVYDDVVVVVEK